MLHSHVSDVPVPMDPNAKHFMILSSSCSYGLTGSLLEMTFPEVIEVDEGDHHMLQYTSNRQKWRPSGLSEVVKDKQTVQYSSGDGAQIEDSGCASGREIVGTLAGATGTTLEARTFSVKRHTKTQHASHLADLVLTENCILYFDDISSKLSMTSKELYRRYETRQWLRRKSDDIRHRR